MKKLVFLVCMGMLLCTQINAQKWLEKVGQRAINTAKQKVENRASQKAGEATDKVLDKLEKKDKKNVETEQGDFAESVSGRVLQPRDERGDTDTAADPYLTCRIRVSQEAAEGGLDFCMHSHFRVGNQSSREVA